MILQTKLLEEFSNKANCDYLSDLRCLHEWQRARLARALEQIPPNAADLNEWNDALDYLARYPPEQSAEAARKRLIQLLSHPQQGPAFGTAPICPKAKKYERGMRT